MGQMLLSLLILTTVQPDRNVVIYLSKTDPIKCCNPQSTWEQQTEILFAGLCTKQELQDCPCVQLLKELNSGTSEMI